MKSWLMRQAGPANSLALVDLPDPEPRDGWVLIDVKAFGLNRSELYTRQGHSGDAVTLPRVLGIECVGLVTDAGGTDVKVGQSVAAAMGGLGRTHHGGYSTKTLVARNTCSLSIPPSIGPLSGLCPRHISRRGVPLLMRVTSDPGRLCSSEAELLR
jgi:NADPH:quinone reductase-like Zn-dependent oxidoreductase